MSNETPTGRSDDRDRTDFDTDQSRADDLRDDELQADELARTESGPDDLADTDLADTDATHADATDSRFRTTPDSPAVPYSGDPVGSRRDTDAAAPGALIEPGSLNEPTPVYEQATHHAPGALDDSAPASEPTPLIEPEPSHTAHAPNDTSAAPAAAPDRGTYAGASDPALAPDAATAVAPTVVAAPLAPTPQVVYVTQPSPPKPQGNRVAGVLFALLAGVVFGLVFAGVALLLDLIGVIDESPSFFVGPVFWAPIVVFTVAYVLVTLVVNRAGWWAHVLGGFIVALLTYGGYLLGEWLQAGAWSGVSSSEAAAFFEPLWLHPLAVAAFVIGREVPIWLGAAVGSRGRRVATRNAEARATYDREQSAVRADYEQRRTASGAI